MEKIFTTMIIAFFLGGQLFCQTPKLSDYHLTIDKKSNFRKDNKTFLLIRATLSNQSKDTLRYHSKSCSWQDYYSIDNNTLKIVSPECDKNIPIILTLAPQQLKQVDIKIEIPSNQSLNKQGFRIGFHLLIDRTYMDNYEVGEEFRRNVLWSNKIIL